MAPVNPVSYIIKRQYDESFVVKDTFFKRRMAAAKNLYRKDLLGHYGCVNAIEFSARGEYLVSGGDDRRVLLWSIPEAIHDKGRPAQMQTSHISNIFCLAFDSVNSKIFSGGNDDQVIVHDIRSGNLVVNFKHSKPVYGLSVDPTNDSIFSTAGDDGRILIYDIREPPEGPPTCIARAKTGYHSVMYNPMDPTLLATANADMGIALWDVRKPKEVLIHYDKHAGKASGISACFNSAGTHLLALRRRLPPVLYRTHDQNAICQFYHPQYYNSCTMKTCSFAGDDDEYILSGSDDFNLYMWKIPTDDTTEWGESHTVLRGHRSIVNQVRYNKQNNLIASSGVEKMVKLWSTLPVGTWTGSLVSDNEEAQRSIYSHDDYIFLVGYTGQRISHDYSDQSTREDSRMIAFFDSLVQREIEGWDSFFDETSSSDSDHNQNFLNSPGTKKVSEENGKKHKPNRIGQLIAQKRNQLARMASIKSTSMFMRKHMKKEAKKERERRKRKFKNKRLPKQRKCKQPPLVRPSSVVRKQVKSKKYRTRQSVKDNCESSTSNNSFDAPSTSTGITGTSTVFRYLEEQDSEEEAPPYNCDETRDVPQDNFVNILPTPLNGTHDMYINVLEINNTNSSNNVGALADGEFPQPSSSNSTFSNEEIFDDFESYPKSPTYYSDSDSNCEFNFTPAKKRRSAGEVDSGFATGPCCSSGSSKRSKPRSNVPSNGKLNDSSDDEFNCGRYKKRVKKSRVNVRKQLCADSDSN